MSFYMSPVIEERFKVVYTTVTLEVLVAGCEGCELLTIISAAADESRKIVRRSVKRVLFMR